MEMDEEQIEGLLIGATILDGGKIEGIHFTHYSDDAVLLNIRYAGDKWLRLLVPSENIRFVQSIPSTLVGEAP
jgi:hypothetical protein